MEVAVEGLLGRIGQWYISLPVILKRTLLRQITLGQKMNELSYRVQMKDLVFKSPLIVY